MKAKDKEKTAAALSQEDVFRKKANSYLVCFIDQCPLHDQCLRWIVGQYADQTPLAHNAINPRNPKIGGEQCVMFRKNERLLMKRGMTGFYRQMPGYMEHRIRQMLILTFGHKKYFEMRRGDRPITPEQQQDIADACRHHGWNGPLVYDDEQEDWLW